MKKPGKTRLEAYKTRLGVYRVRLGSYRVRPEAYKGLRMIFIPSGTFVLIVVHLYYCNNS
jgi:hypothetical protein